MQLSDTCLCTEYGLDLGYILQLNHVDGKLVRKTLYDDLVLGTGHDLDRVDEPRDRNVLVTDDALEDGALANVRCHVRQRLCDYVLKVNDLMM